LSSSIPYWLVLWLAPRLKTTNVMLDIIMYTQNVKSIVQEAQTANFIGTGRILGRVAQKERHLAKATRKREKIKV
jgi:hypothetical protein